jgi:hypothetical protein
VSGRFADRSEDMAQGLDGDSGAFDELLAEQLIDATEGESLPESYRLLADVLAAARAPALEGELVIEPEAVSLFRVNRLTNGATSTSSRKRRIRQLTVLLAAGGLTVATAGATAAATGSLPDDVQDFASSMLSKFGISVPRGHRISPEPPARPSAVASSTPSAAIPVPPTDDDERISGLTTNLSAVPVHTATARSSSPADPAASPAKAHRPAPRHDGPASPPTTVAPSPAKAHPPAPSDDPPSAPNAAPPAPLEDAPPSPPAADAPSPSPGGPPLSPPGGPPPSPPGGPPPSRSPADPPSPSPGGPPPSRPGGPPPSPPGGPPPSPPAADPRSPGGPSPSPPGRRPSSPPDGRPSSPTGGRP